MTTLDLWKNFFCHTFFVRAYYDFEGVFSRIMGATYYIQICPTCGRRLEVKIEYIGLEVNCYHCRARFIAENSCDNRMSGSLFVSQNASIADVISYCPHYAGEGPVSSFS